MELNNILLASLFYLSAINGVLQQKAKLSCTLASSDFYFNNLIHDLSQVFKDFKDIPVRETKGPPINRLFISDEVTAKRIARLPGAAYCVKAFNENRYETRGYIGLDPTNKFIVVPFRGTSNIKNWVQNVKVDKVDLFSGNSKVQVHLGFKQARDALSLVYTPVVKDLLKNNPGFKLVVTGHSLGGAIANLAAIDLQASQQLSWGNIQLFTYGQPRVGNSDFATWFDSLSLLSTRVTNNKDIVPHVPP
ncbi:alpha/beta-hydrolase, partial [Neoconidiobolus thromboides FSU 785]